MTLKAPIVSAEATADGLKHFRLTTSVLFFLLKLKFTSRLAEKGFQQD